MIQTKSGRFCYQKLKASVIKESSHTDNKVNARHQELTEIIKNFREAVY